MINLQNPSIPIQQDPVEIDRVIIDLQTVLSNNLPWLTQPYGRAYKNLDVSNGSRLYYPQVYLGKDRLEPKYLTITPDNDKEGQCFFYVERETLSEQQQGQYGFLNYNLSIIFSVNLDLINSSLLETDLFTANLVKDVREVLRQNLGKEYQLTVTTVDYLIERVFSGFNIEIQTIEKAPLQHFRFNANVLLAEDCSNLPYDSCDVLLGNLTEAQKNDCILRSFDFSDPVVQGSTTVQQQTDLTNWLCSPAPATPLSATLNGVDSYIYSPVTSVYDFEYNTPFTFSTWIKLTTLNTCTVFNHNISSKGYFCIINSNGSIRCDLANTGLLRLSVTTNTSLVTIGEWLNITVTYGGVSNPSSLNIYLNGVLLSKNATTNTLGSNSIKQPTLPVFWGLNMINVLPINGLIDLIDVWDLELSAADVLGTYNNKGLLPPVQPSNHIGGCKCGDNAVFGADSFIMPDASGTVTGFQTKNVPITGLSIDVPS